MSSHYIKLFSFLCLSGSILSASCFQYIYVSVRNGQEKPGLYGGLLNISNLGEGVNLYSAGYNSMKYEDSDEVSRMEGMEVLSTNYDPMSEQVLVQTSHSDLTTNLVTVGMGPLCDNVNFEEFPMTSTLMSVDSMNYTIGPFSYFDSEIYFISRHTTTTGSFRYEVINLRHAETCDESFPMKDRRLDFAACSTSVTEVINRILPDTSSTHYYPGNSMYKIVTQSALMFYLQVFKVVDGVVTESELFDISAYTKIPRLLHKEEIDDTSPAVELLQSSGGFGGMAYRDNRLCWTALRKVYCGLWTNKNDFLEDLKLVLEPEEISNFCAGGSAPTNDWIIQDVSIAQTYHPVVDGLELYLYFTCLHSQSGVNGPTGLLRMNETGEKILYPVTSGGRPVMGGSLFLQRTLSRHCPEPVNPSGSPSPPGQPPTPPSNLAPALQSAFKVIGIGLLVQVAMYMYFYYRNSLLFTAEERRPAPDIHL